MKFLKQAFNFLICRFNMNRKLDQHQIHRSHKLVESVTRDVKEQKLAEESLLRAQNELQNTVRNIQGIIFKVVKEDKGRFVHTLCEGQLLSELNLSSERILGHDLYEIFPTDMADYMQGFNERAWTGEDVHYELHFYERNLLVTLTPVYAAGKVIEVVGSCIDVTKLKMTEELLIKADKLAMIGQLAAGIAHEIRNPLTTLKGFLQLYKSQLEAKGFGFTDLMLSEIDRMEWITGEFLTLSKHKPEQYQLRDVKKIVEHVQDFITPQAHLNNVEILTEWRSKIPRLLCDGNSLKQVFINLIKNAIEAMPNGGKVHVTGQAKHERILIRIKDEGMGIPKEHMERLGEPFYSLKEKGTGLGLMICYKIVEEHEGMIYIDSKVSVGTTVTLSFPSPFTKK
jgi:signal transduction histidine kinase